MQIKNTGQETRTLSREGVDIPLFPGASVEYPLTEAEAKAYRGIGFEVTGEPSDAGLRLDDANHQDEAREDFRFLRRLRQTWDGTSNKVGGAVLTAVIGVAFIIFGSGFWQWISNGGKGRR